ncbi:hypothetical protein GTA08_BOTSDO08219 [Botryosphaeria dothidea]|uniref:Secreted protein n=1 Tax=Botryosphaeria dothidea TaxID=55169 RepID=A0A8H4IMS9_9PEZI|nr:hypothetical protein GTA08_BOTSDO08219 [Botryosphaeria dothidea]
MPARVPAWATAAAKILLPLLRAHTLPPQQLGPLLYSLPTHSAEIAATPAQRSRPLQRRKTSPTGASSSPLATSGQPAPPSTGDRLALGPNFGPFRSALTLGAVSQPFQPCKKKKGPLWVGQYS